MKFSCLQENLGKALQIVSRAVASKSTLPILSNVYINAHNDKVTLAATNLETAIITNMRASVEEEGKTTIPARPLKEFVSTISHDKIKAELIKEVLHLSSNKTKSRFNGSSAEDFPELPAFPEKAKYIELDPQVFNSAVNIVAFASGSDSTRPIFTGVNLQYSGGKLTLVSTDGFRLSEKTINLDSKQKDFNAIIPAKTLVEISKIFSTSQEPIKVTLSENENLILFKAEDTYVASRLLDGQYVDYKKIIPTEFIVNAEFDTAEFLEAARLANIFAKEEDNNAIKIRIDPDREIIQIKSLEGKTGEHTSDIDSKIEGDMIEIAFNAKYLLDFLNNVKSKRIKFSTNSNTSPCVLITEEYKDFQHIIMPMQI